MRYLLLLLVLSVLSFAQAAPHTVSLLWTDPGNPTGVVYNVYRATGACSTTSVFSTKLNAAPLTVLNFDDTSVNPGKYCYVVRANFNNIDSPDSNQADAMVKPFSVTITVTVAK